MSEEKTRLRDVDERVGKLTLPALCVASSAKLKELERLGPKCKGIGGFNPVLALPS